MPWAEVNSIQNVDTDPSIGPSEPVKSTHAVARPCKTVQKERSQLKLLAGAIKPNRKRYACTALTHLCTHTHALTYV